MRGEELDLLGDELLAQVTVVDLEVVGPVVPDRGARAVAAARATPAGSTRFSWSLNADQVSGQGTSGSRAVAW